MVRKNLIAIVGPTASGKTSLAIKLAKKYDGEIICADSRTVYKGMDIGTAKPTSPEQSIVQHHCIDLVTPDQRYSVTQFKEVAEGAIQDISSRDKLAFLVGGSGLYIDAVVYDFSFAEQLEINVDGLSLAELQKLAADLGLNPSVQVSKNSRHLAGYIKRGGVQGQKKLAKDVLIIGMKVEKSELERRIAKRVEKMFNDGMVEETNTLLEKWGERAPGLQAPGYKPLVEYAKGRIGLEEAKLMFIRNDKQLAKRQMTWFERNKDIQWVDSQDQAEQLIKEKIGVFDTM